MGGGGWVAGQELCFDIGKSCAFVLSNLISFGSFLFLF